MRPLRRLAPALALLLLAATAPGAGAIVNGQPASRAVYPYFAIAGAGCGGALVTPTRVLTAAHCREVVAESMRVDVGPRAEVRRVTRIALHPVQVRELAKAQREFPPPAADLMLLSLSRPVTDVPVLRIARASDRLTRPGTRVVTIGRGASSANGEGEGVFRQGTVQIQNPFTCDEQLGDALLRRWSICTRDPRMADAAYPGPFVSACFGDSGGPLLAGPANRRRLVGVVSWGPSCGTERDPEIYANAVEGRRFALARRVVWAPQAAARARIAGVARVGRTVRCAVRWRVRPTRDVVYSFTVGGFTKQEGRRNRFYLRGAFSGKKVECGVAGATAGGRGGTPGLSFAKLVRPRTS
jgi:hypothetical protein